MSAPIGARFLGQDFSDESDNEAGYDSEAAEISKSARPSKRRKVDRDHDHDHYDDHEDEDEDEDEDKDARDDAPEQNAHADADADGTRNKASRSRAGARSDQMDVTGTTSLTEGAATHTSTPATGKQPDRDKGKTKAGVPPGVVYLSSVPPYLKPSALRNLLAQRGFGPIQRLFLSPASKHKSTSKKNSRQMYTEGWVEFASKKTARRCAETLNAQLVAGRKGGFYHDDVWNMKYLRGMQWDELMAGIREEKREEEGKRDDERRTIAHETKRFISGVDEGRRKDGMKRKRELQGRPKVEPGEPAVRRTWKQTEVKGSRSRHEDSRTNVGDQHISDEVQSVLNQIF